MSIGDYHLGSQLTGGRHHPVPMPDWTYRPAVTAPLPRQPHRFDPPHLVRPTITGPYTLPAAAPPMPSPSSPAVTGADVEAIREQMLVLVARLQALPAEALEFLRAVLAAPDDRDLFLILADWLEEHAPPRRKGASKRKAARKLRRLADG